MSCHLSRALFLLVPLFFSDETEAQKRNLELHIKDSASRLPIAKASAVILGIKDSAFMDMGVTDTSGILLFKNINTLKAGTIVITAMGYNDQKIIISRIPEITEPGKNIIKLEVQLSNKYSLLEDITVTSGSPIRMNKDTLEFNAEFFKTRSNDILEDLLRKLPGVEVRENGEVYVNGQRVNKILVDGKEFFSSDPLVILRNLPSEIIAKIQVADEKNTIIKETRMQKDIPKTINLKLKKEIKKGVFGKFFGGYGSDERYEAGGIANMFRDTLQVSLIGTSSNQGRGGFTMQDLNDLGGFSRSKDLGASESRDVAFAGLGSGISTNHLGGININYNLGNKLQTNAQYFYKENRRLISDRSKSQQFIGDSIVYGNGITKSNSESYAHNASFGLKWKQDSTGYLMTTLQVSTNNATGSSFDSGSLLTAKSDMISSSEKIANKSSSNRMINLNADYSKAFEKPGIDWNLSLNLYNKVQRSNDMSNASYRQLITGNIPDSIIQLRKNNIPVKGITIINNLNKTWNDRHMLGWDLKLRLQDNTSGGDTYQYSKTSGKNEILPAMSIILNRKVSAITNTISYRYNRKTFKFQLGLSLNNMKTNNDYVPGTIAGMKNSFDMLSPLASLNLKNFNFSFNSELTEPDLYYLSPVTDNTNPLFVHEPTPNLKPVRSNNINLGYSKFFKREKINFAINSRLSRKKDEIISSTTLYDGKTTYRYVNAEKSDNYNLNLSISKTYAKNNWSYSISTAAYSTISSSPTLINNNQYNITDYSNSINFGGYIGYKNTFKWRPGYLISMRRSKGDGGVALNNSTFRHTISNSIHLQLLPKLSWDANLNYTLTPGISEGYKKSWFFADMALAWSFMKKDQAQVRLSGFDLFNQNQGTYRGANKNYIYDYDYLVQKQYFMLTLVYSLKKF